MHSTTTTITITFILFKLIHAAFFLREDKPCDPLQTNKLPYTGFRLHRQYTLGYPILHHQRLTHCDHGKVDLESFIPLDRNTDIKWGVSMCVDNQLCYRAVRRKKYAHRAISSLYPKDSIIGGLFQCPINENCTNQNSYPMFPLLADELGQQWWEFPKFKRIIQRIAYFSTPHFTDKRYPHRLDKHYKWAKQLDINENYKYTKRDKIKINYANTKLINIVHKTLVIDSDLLPWERSRIVKELNRDLKQHENAKSVDLVAKLLPIFHKLSNDKVDKFIKKLQTPYEKLKLDDDGSLEQDIKEDLELDNDPLHEYYSKKLRKK